MPDKVAGVDRTGFKDAGCDPNLLAACQAGERDARGELYRIYRRDVARAVARILGGDSPDLEDAVQDTFIEVFRAIPKFRGDSLLTTWIYRVAMNVALQRLRKRRRSREAPTPPPEVATHHTPEREAAAREKTRLVERLVGKLSPKKRAVFVLHEIAGLDAPEIAKIVGSPALTVRTRLHYARKEFYKLVMEERLLDAGGSE